MRVRASLVAALATTTVITGPAAAAAAPPPEGGSVTLVTGDRVLLAPDGRILTVEPAPGREHIPITRYSSGGHEHVVPHDAVPLLTADRLDPRLFDITLLREFGYDDRRATLPLITDRPVAVARDGSRWPALTGTDGKVWLDGKRTVFLDESVPRIGAPAAWAAGYTGEGVTVAVVDTGVDQTHPDLAGREQAEASFGGSPDTVDRDGHGTHVASTVSAVAPGAKLLDAKVFDDDGFTTESAIIAGLTWAVEQGADVVNLSLGAEDLPGADPVEAAVGTLSAEHGVLVVAAAGNAYQPGTVGSPASADAALAVGAVDGTDAMAPFSSRGPRVGDGAVKPEITAPGVGITAAKPGGGHADMDGTSMASPHVAGAAALLAQRRPEWTGAQLKAALVASATPSDDATPFDQGAGRVTVPAAIDQTVTAEPATVNAGVVAFPYAEPVTRTLTYRNAGPADVTLTLAVDNPVFSLPSHVTVPAGGGTTVTVTAHAATDGSHAGTIVATGADTSVRTPVSVLNEPESYDVAFELIGRDGSPAESNVVKVLPLDGSGGRVVTAPGGSLTLRLPAGGYLAEVGIDEGGETHVLAYPALDVTEDRTIVLDARTARPVRVTPPDPAAELLGLDIGVERRTAAGRGYIATLYDRPVSLAHVGPALPADRMTSWVAAHFTGAAFYGLAWFTRGTVPTGFVRTVGARDVAKVVTDVAGGRAERMSFPSPIGGFDPGWGQEVTWAVAAPLTRVAYHNAGAEWSHFLRDESASTVSPSRRYRAGVEYVERFGYPVFGPGVRASHYPAPGGFRDGDRLDVRMPLFADSAGNVSWSSLEQGRTELYRGDELVGESPAPGAGLFEVPPGAAEYRLTASATRPGATLSTAVSATWTFRSAHGTARLPLSSVRFTPELTDGTAPAGPFRVPVTVERGHAGSLTVEVSYDEGASWQRVRVAGGVARLDHPATADAVSLRAGVTNRDGSTVTQTIIRAYLLD